MCTKLITGIIQNYPRSVNHNIVFLTLLVSLNLFLWQSNKSLYAQSPEDVATNGAFFSYLSDTIIDQPLFNDLSTVSLKTELPTAFAQRLRASIIEKQVTLSSSADQNLSLSFTTNNIYEKSRDEKVKRLLTGTVEILIENKNGTILKQDLIEYSYSDTIQDDAFNRLTDNDLTKPDQVMEAPGGLWQKFGIPAIILSGIGTATVLLFYVRG